jgi:hypothetical protein
MPEMNLRVSIQQNDILDANENPYQTIISRSTTKQRKSSFGKTKKSTNKPNPAWKRAMKYWTCCGLLRT